MICSLFKVLHLVPLLLRAAQSLSPESTFLALERSAARPAVKCITSAIPLAAAHCNITSSQTALSLINHHCRSAKAVLYSVLNCGVTVCSGNAHLPCWCCCLARSPEDRRNLRCRQRHAAHAEQTLLFQNAKQLLGTLRQQGLQLVKQSILRYACKQQTAS